MASKRDRNANSRKQRNRIRRRTILVVLCILPVVVGAVWFSFANKIIDQVNGYNTQSTLLSRTESSHDTLNYNLKAAAAGYIASEGNAMLASLDELNPGYKNAMSKITSAHAPGSAELQASLDAYTAVAKTAVDLALSSKYTPAGVAAIINSKAYTSTDEQVGLSAAAARLGLEGASDRGDGNWKVLVVAQLAITIFITALAIALTLMSERAIKRADDSEEARHLDRINMATEPFTHVVATMSDGVLVLSADQTILHANPSAQALLGIGITVGSTYNIPTDGHIEIRKPDGSTSSASTTTSTAVTGGQPVTILTIREN